MGHNGPESPRNPVLFTENQKKMKAGHVTFLAQERQLRIKVNQSEIVHPRGKRDGFVTEIDFGGGGH